MSDEYVPQLTLGPEGFMSQPAPAAPETPTMAQEAPVEKLDMSVLTEQEQKMVRDFAEKIDITDTNTVLTYGAAAQKKIADFTASTLGSVKTKDMGEVGEMLSSLVLQLKSFGQEETEKKGLFGITRKVRRRIEEMKAEYNKVEVNVNKIAEELEKHQYTLLKDAAMLDEMYKMNQAYFKELTMYILAGKEKLRQCKELVLPQLKQKAIESGKPEDAQAVNDYENMISRFEKKLHDLELTRTICLQMAPQIRLIQNNDTLMVEKIQTSLVNTIPLWKSQMVLALGLHHSRQAMEAQRAVTNVTNELLRRNAETLKMGSIDIARESERGIVDLETLKHTNQMLIETLESVRQIQEEGAKKRREAEAELGRIENELKQKLLDIRKQ